MAKSFKTPKTIKLFLDECKEYITNLNQDLVELEGGDTDEELIKRISRNVHTIKGSSAMLEFMDVSEIAHQIEDVMEKLKKKFPAVDKEFLDAIFQKVDVIDGILLKIENGSYEEGSAAPAAAAPAPKAEPEPAPPPPPPPPPPPEPKPEPELVAKDAKKQPEPPKKKKQLIAPAVGRTGVLEIAGSDILPSIDRCFALFADVESKFLMADDSSGDAGFIDKMFDSVKQLQRSLVCFGQAEINESLARLLMVKKAAAAGKAELGQRTAELIFKGVIHVKAVLESLTSAERPKAPDPAPFFKSVDVALEKARAEKDYMAKGAASELFDRLNVGKDALKYFTPFEKQCVGTAMIDDRNVFRLKMSFKTHELGDLASMSEFFKPLADDGEFLACIIVAVGMDVTVTGYDFHLFFGTAMSMDEFDRKYAYLKKTGIKATEIGLSGETAEAAPAPGGGESEEKPGEAPARLAGGRREKAKKSGSVATVRVDTVKLDDLVNLIAELVINHNKLEQEIKQLKQTANAAGDILDALKLGRKSNGLSERNITQDDLLQPFKTLQPDAFDESGARRETGLAGRAKELRIIRESVMELYDMELEKDRMLSELNAKIAALKSEIESLNQEFQTDGLNIGRVIFELQEETMKLRMMPISNVLSKFPRRVRDYARQLDKKIEFIVEGEDTELDKNLIEELEDPLLHIIRNAIDHGIETTAHRQAAGKPDTGIIRVKASHEGNSVVIDIEDDGKGMDGKVLKKKCVEKRLITPEQAAQMDDKEAVNLIFIPGFSSKDQVSDLSGRGVGMDVVKTGISKLKGSVDVNTEPGNGTMIKLKLPLTLAIIQAMIVKCAGRKFVIPMDPIESAEQVKSSEVRSVEGREVYKFHDMVIPLMRLRDVFSLGDEEGTRPAQFPVVIMTHGDKKIGLIVDEVIEKQQVVIKSLGEFLGDVKNISGTTIFGDGSMALIIDVPGIVQSIPRLSKRLERASAGADEKSRKHILLVDDSLSGRIAQREMIERMGYTVEVASSGMQALARLAERRYDMIVTDINMPRMDGYEFTQKVRSSPDIHRIPIIMVTSDIKSADRQKAYDVGIDDFLAKPFSEDDLKIAIEKHMRPY